MTDTLAMIASQLCTIGYFATIVSIFFNALSAACSGVKPFLMTSASAAPRFGWH